MSRRVSSTRTSTESEGDTDRARPFVVPVAALRRNVGDSRREQCRGVIDGLGAVGISVPDGEPVVLDVSLSSYPGGITVQGTVQARWVGECRRCGGAVSSVVNADVRERFTPVGGTDRDEDAYPIAGDELDLEPLARDAVLLELPLAPLCSPDCRGLCPQCGANWNLETCDCPTTRDPRWSALDALRDPGGPGLT
jgi:uncharacterized protein